VSEIVVTGFGAVRGPDLDGFPETLRARAARTERVTQLAFSAAGPALAMAGLVSTDGEPRPRLGIVLGTAFGCWLTNAAFHRRFADGGPAAASPRLFAATVSNAAAGELAIAYRLGGPAVTLAAGSVAGLVAIGHAVDLLRAGQADVLLTGGMDAADASLDRWIDAGGLASVAPIGEGAALLVVERREHADARGARTRAIVRETETTFHAEADGTAPRGFAAAGPCDVIATLERLAPNETARIAGRCPSGHAASVVVQRPA
jgi:3-oxoacyl-[acyl-carrier-protein] synthase II